MIVLQYPELVQLVSAVFGVGIARQVFLRLFATIGDEGSLVNSLLCVKTVHCQAGARQKKRGL